VQNVPVRSRHLRRTRLPLYLAVLLLLGIVCSALAAPNRATLAQATGPNTWASGPNLPGAIGEVAGGIIGTKMYLVGESWNSTNNAATFAYDLVTGQWSNNLAQRPHKGNHHTAEVINGKLYLFGGFGDNSPGKVQIYNPATNQWSLGANMPWNTGSANSAVIGGKVYVFGGIVGQNTVTQGGIYDPATNSWAATAPAPMPQGRNHAAFATDGQRLFVFGGRGPGSGDSNIVANGFNTVQIYNPATNSWVSSATPGSTLAPLPIGRGGMGKAVYVNGEFYVIGGETKDGPGAVNGNVYNRVDIYNPTTNTWRTGKEMPTARHGIFPMLYNGKLYVGAGGTKAAFSISNIFEIYTVSAQSPPTATATNTATATATNTATATATNTATATATNTATATATNTPTATATSAPGDPTATATNTPTATPTNTVVPGPAPIPRLYLPLLGNTGANTGNAASQPADAQALINPLIAPAPELAFARTLMNPLTLAQDQFLCRVEV
jgi:N-acetylneuraminic acid mutarotase